MNKFSVQAFTLVELLIAMLIVSILASIAYPSYTQYRQKILRTEAQLALSALSAAMSQHYSLHLTYVSAAEGSDGITPISSATKPQIFAHSIPQDRAEKLYTLNIIEADAFSFIVRALPIRGAIMEGDGFLQLDSSGRQAWDRDDSGSVNDNEQCWSENGCG